MTVLNLRRRLLGNLRTQNRKQRTRLLGSWTAWLMQHGPADKTLEHHPPCRDAGHEVLDVSLPLPHLYT